MWKSQVDIFYIIDEYEEKVRLDKLFSLSVLWGHAIYSKEYVADKAWESNLVFTDYGKKVFNLILSNGQIEKSSNYYLALFCSFNHHDLYFDWEKTNIDNIEALLNHEINVGKIKYPYSFARDLYDRFNDVNQANRTDHLLHDDVLHLLEDTPKGVYQVTNTLIGALGVLSSLEARTIYPQLELPLWHCSDTGCGALHGVKLVTNESAITLLIEMISVELNNVYGPPSEWFNSLKTFHRDELWENGKPFCNVCELIAESIFGDERTSLVELALLGSNKRLLRDILDKPPRKSTFSQGSAKEVAIKLNTTEQLHLLFVLTDSELVELIDELVFKKIIKLPIGEVRKPQCWHKLTGKDHSVSLSSRGVRSFVDDPVSMLTTLVLRAYNEANLEQDLAWKVKGDISINLKKSVFNYIVKLGPQEAITNLVLSSSTVTRHICKEVNLSMKFVDVNQISNERLLWKLGFNPEEYDLIVPRIKSKNREFKELLLSLSSIEEEEREQVRSVGVNLFVYLEDYLDRFISYNIWLLSSDHFMETKFDFDIIRARTVVSTILGNTITNDDCELTWSTKGNNTLGVLLAYLAKASAWVSSLNKENRNPFIRDEDDLPHFTNDSYVPFPFKHNQLWADCDPTELDSFSNGFNKISKLFLQANLAEIRNGIDHHRDGDSFPDNDKMIACVSRLEEAFDNADINRFFPKYYWLISKNTSRYGVEQYVFSDYSKRNLTVHGPSSVSALPSKSFTFPVIIEPYNLLGSPNSKIVVQVKESSVFSDYWNGYPRRRKIEVSEVVINERSLVTEMVP